MLDRLKVLRVAGWVVTICITVFMLCDVAPDLQQAPWAVTANAAFGIPGDLVLLIGIAGLASTLLYVLPHTAPLGAILLSGFLGGAVFTHLRVHGDPYDIGENILIGLLA